MLIRSILLWLTGNQFFLFDVQQSTSAYYMRKYRVQCCALAEHEVSSFLRHMNSIEPSIQFTCEVEKDHLLPFLDILLHHKQDGSISASVYHKPTHTCTHQYLDFSAHHAVIHKVAVVRTLQCQAVTLYSSTVAADRALEYH